jgi:fatty-acyl-CoA synthase
MLFGHVDTEQRKPSRELCLEKVIIGGAAAPLSMIERFARDFDAAVIHAWGMTELSPLGTVCRLLPKHRALAPDERHRLQLKQGRAVFGVSLKIVDDEGRRLPQDGETAGHLMVRGPWVAREYFGAPGALQLDAEGYFATGDVATIDRDGYMLITDRAKDVIKSGGEWISSIELENAAMGHPDVAQAAVIGVPHPSWQERPLLIAVRKEGRQVGRDELLAHIAGSVARWWLPDDVVFVEALPHTATGKVQKMRLRDEYRNHRLPTPADGAGRSSGPAHGDAAGERA